MINLFGLFSKDELSAELKPLFYLIFIVWSVLLFILSLWNYRSFQSHQERIALEAARHSVAKDVAYRHWAAEQGGVYVPVTDHLQPSPYLASVSERDVETPSGRLLTLVNPAWMTRQVHEMSNAEFGTKGHITSLKNLRPENAPDPWEKAVLLGFDKGQREEWSISEIGGEKYLRFMRAFVTEEPCLKCHAHQGYRVGDVRGGISVSIPWAPYGKILQERLYHLVMSHGAIWFIGVLGLVFTRIYFVHLIARRRQAERSAESNALRFQALFESMMEGVALHEMIYDEKGAPLDYRLIDVNPAYQKNTGIETATALGRLGSELYGMSPPPYIDTFEKVAKSGEPYQFEVFFSPLQRHFSISVASASAGQFATVFEDITQRKKYERQLEYQATHDVFTGLANRNLLVDRISQSILFAERSQRIVGVLLLDLNRFKDVNSSYGHACADELLKQVAERLKEGVRECDTIARMGGDEFAIVFAEVGDIHDLSMLAREVMQVFDAPYRLEGREIYLTASIGISTFPRDGRDAKTLIRNADNALRRSKERGDNAFTFFAPEMNTSAQERLELEGALRKALELKELVVYYQPQIEIATGHIKGCEALVRWQHPTKGLVFPDKFIPLAEETGLVVQIDAYVLHASCEMIRRWQHAGLQPVPIAVNMSAKHFNQDDLAEQIRKVLDSHAIDPKLLKLEITESTIMAHPDRAARTMDNLKKLGFDLFLDDFGTGYSSLNYLRRFPVDGLKIDRSFVGKVTDDRTDAALTRYIIAIACELGVATIAEGVETREQLNVLADWKCDSFQGYLFSKPVPGAEFTDMLRKGRAWNEKV